jgi:hypothetical protein
MKLASGSVDPDPDVLVGSGSGIGDQILLWILIKAQLKKTFWRIEH